MAESGSDTTQDKMSGNESMYVLAYIVLSRITAGLV